MLVSWAFVSCRGSSLAYVSCRWPLLALIGPGCPALAVVAFIVLRCPALSFVGPRNGSGNGGGGHRCSMQSIE